MDPTIMVWWHWIVLGIILLLLEALTPGALFTIFFGFGAIVVGLLSAFGLAGLLWMQILLFVVLSVAALLLLRRFLVAKLRFGDPGAKVDRLVGEMARALEDVPVDAVGKVELRGSPWNARNVGETPLLKGQQCSVVRLEGLTLWVSCE